MARNRHKKYPSRIDVPAVKRRYVIRDFFSTVEDLDINLLYWKEIFPGFRIKVIDDKLVMFPKGQPMFIIRRIE